MAISVISVSSDSPEESVGTPAGRVILFGTILTTIPNTTPTISPPTTHTDTTVTLTEIPTVLPTVLPTSDPSEDPSLDHIPPLPAISPFLSSTDDTTDSDTPDTPPSPTYDASYNSFWRHSLPDHSSPDLPSTSAGPSCKRRRSPMTSVPALSPVFGALSPVRADLIPSSNRIRDSDYLADVEVDSRESYEPSRSRGTDVGVDDDIERVDESHSEPEIDHVQATIEACFDFADIIRSRGINVRVVAETVARDEIGTDTRDIVEGGDDGVTHPVVSDDRFHDHTVAIPVHRVQVIEGVQREQGHGIVGVESAVTALTERIVELERDNRRLRGTASVEGQRVDRLQYGMSHMQRELRQVRRLRFYDRVRVGRLEAFARKHMGYRL
ncbi:hypothetical protein Tco_0074128 [Tanacetum coccineum]